jgi:hypothetical protein
MQIGNWFGPIFGAYGCFPGQWQRKAGDLVYFFEDPGFLPAVKLLSNWYAAGLVDPEWVTTAASDRAGTTEDLFVRFAKGDIAVLYNVGHADFRPWDRFNNEQMTLVGAEASSRWQAYNPGWESTTAFGDAWTAGRPPVGPSGASGNLRTTAAAFALMIGSHADDARTARLLNYLEVMATDPEAYLANFAGPPGVYDVVLDVTEMPDSPTGKTYVFNKYEAEMNAGTRPKDDNYRKVWGSGYFSPWVHWHPNIQYIWAGHTLKGRTSLAEEIADFPGYSNAFILPLPSRAEYADLDRIVAEFTAKAITGAYRDIDAEYARALGSWKRNGGDVLTGEANELYGRP